MKTHKIIIIILTNIFCLYSHAQTVNNDSLARMLARMNATLTARELQTNKKFDSLKNLVHSQSKNDSIINAKRDSINSTHLKNIKTILQTNPNKSHITVGTLKLKKVKIPIIKEDGRNSTRTHYRTIDSVQIVSQEGYILTIYVFIRDSVYVNTKVPIELSSRRISLCDKLYCTLDGNQYIQTCDILTYTHVGLSSPDDDQFTLNRVDSTRRFYKGVGINDIFEIKVFTDMLGLLGEKSNGLVQTDINYKHILHRSNWNEYSVFFFQNFKFNAKVSKFDSKFKYTDSSSFTRSDFLQRNWISSDVSLCVLKYIAPRRSLNYLYIDVGAGAHLSNLAKPRDTLSILSDYWFYELGYCAFKNDKLGVNLKSRHIFNYSPKTPFNSGKTYFFNPSVEFFYNPEGNDVGKAYLKISLFSDRNTKIHDFLQIQLGYSIKLSSLKIP